MDSKIFWQLNEAYQLGVCNQEVVEEEALSEDELVDIQEWVEALIQEGYNLDDYTDDELYEAYLEEALTGARKDYALKRANELRNMSRQVGDIAKRSRGGKHGISDKMDQRAANLLKVATREVGNGSWETYPRNRGGSGIKGDPKDMESGVDHSRSSKSDKDLIRSKLRKRALRNINRGMNEEVDLYDVISEYLVSEGFCDSYEDATVIMANMSEEWREGILDEANRLETHRNATKRQKIGRRQDRDFRGILHPADWESQGEPERQKEHKNRRGKKG